MRERDGERERATARESESKSESRRERERVREAGAMVRAVSSSGSPVDPRPAQTLPPVTVAPRPPTPSPFRSPVARTCPATRTAILCLGAGSRLLSPAPPRRKKELATFLSLHPQARLLFVVVVDAPTLALHFTNPQPFLFSSRSLTCPFFTPRPRPRPQLDSAAITGTVKPAPKLVVRALRFTPSHSPTLVPTTSLPQHFNT